ncbi:hypothetical protein EYC84_002543 [Monilinia fructicola]|uniref:Uncharacterized protein n=1 Tax=Monilinia fructicola TaxID=38448 RepID=A0A5M9JL52_MONFR|nr:hypothetical protein EYC84_002543 [Monilinia fructicola]
MSPQSMPNFEFVLCEPKTSQVLFNVSFPPRNPSPLLTITAEGISNLLFSAYVLSSIYTLYKFQQAIIRHHKTLRRENPTINTLALCGINYIAIFLHCLWDNVLRYIFNARLGLPYGVSFFYPVPQSPLEMIPSALFPHPTSEDLDFRTKYFLLLGAELGGFMMFRFFLPWYEARPQRPRNVRRTWTGARIQTQAGAGEFAETVRLDKGVSDLLEGCRGVVHLDGCSRGRLGDAAGFCEKGVEGLGSSNAVAEIKTTASLERGKHDRGGVYGESDLASDFEDVIQYPLVGGKESWKEAEIKAVREENGEGGEEECNILDESLVMVNHGKVDLVG